MSLLVLSSSGLSEARVCTCTTLVGGVVVSQVVVICSLVSVVVPVNSVVLPVGSCDVVKSSQSCGTRVFVNHDKVGVKWYVSFDLLIL